MLYTVVKQSELNRTLEDQLWKFYAWCWNCLLKGEYLQLDWRGRAHLLAGVKIELPVNACMNQLGGDWEF